MSWEAIGAMIGGVAAFLTLIVMINESAKRTRTALVGEIGELRLSLQALSLSVGRAEERAAGEQRASAERFSAFSRACDARRDVVDQRLNDHSSRLRALETQLAAHEAADRGDSVPAKRR